MYRYLIASFLLLPAMAGLSVHAAEPTHLLDEIDVQFDYKHVQKGEAGRDQITPEFQSLSSAPGTRFEQYDTRILYPITGNGVRFDVGMNLRYIQGVASNQEKSLTRLDQTIPAFYAAALFDLPFKGMSAGFEGSHTGLTDQIQDYRAKLGYRWESGLGLQGGWQHQQMSFDSGDIAPNITSQGPYLDLNWNF
jgi:hypothetical protein